MKAQFVLSLGANQKEPLTALEAATEKLAASQDVEITKRSGLWLTSPWGPVKQSWFVNQVLGLETSLSPLELLRLCQQVEDDLGRVRTTKWGSRTIDLDLIWCSSGPFSEADLVLPHPRAHERAFVLRPWLEITPTAKLNEVWVKDWADSLPSRGFDSVCVPYR